MEIREYNHLNDFLPFKGDWDRLVEPEPVMMWNFAELKEVLEEEGTTKVRFFVAAEESEVLSIACFIYGTARKRFAVAEHKLIDLPIRQVSLFGGRVIGRADESLIKRFFEAVINYRDFDLVNVGEIPVDSALYRAVNDLRGGVLITKPHRKTAPRWLLNLPASFDDYLKSLGSSTRRSDSRKMRKLEREYDIETRVIERPEEVDRFLEEGETVTRLTYKWALGQGVRNDPGTQHYLKRLARHGHLRCYMVYIDKRPCACVRGEMRRRTFLYHATAFDPKYHSESLGTILMLWVIRDLIEHTGCKVFDFGFGLGSDNDDESYKARYGNASYDCCWIQLGRVGSPYSLFIVALQEGLSLVKNAADAVIGGGRLWQWLRRATRYRVASSK